MRSTLALSCIAGCGNSSPGTTPDAAPALMVVTVAGSGGTGTSVDGVGSAASFNNAYGIAISGTSLYVTDVDRIRQVTSESVVTTLAGGEFGWNDGTGPSAQFDEPYGIATDAAGTGYVTDQGVDMIRMMTSSGVVTTLAGMAAMSGFLDGSGAAAQFAIPRGIAVDGTGTVYVADTGNNAIRKITPDGTVSTLAGSLEQGYAEGTGSAARFDQPAGVAVDGTGNVYVADTYNLRIRKITPDGVVSTLAGDGQAMNVDGIGASAEFQLPTAIAIDPSGDKLFVVSGNQIRTVTTATGAVTTIAGTTGAGWADGPAALAQFSSPAGLAVAANGDIFIADTANHRIRRLYLQ
ncbi:MAG TPA: hypothetical protein VMJ10_06030 [Kofleriaceae bacterium]|nr:hypothetical protein [Kofleriaceae bacterium]